MIETNANAKNVKTTKRPSIRDLQIDRPQSDAMKVRRMPGGGVRPKRRRKLGLGWWILAVVFAVSALVISVPIIFSDTTLNITPVVTKAIFDEAVFNTVENNTEVDLDGLLSYSKVEWTANDSAILEPSGRELVEEKASGVITVYNNYTSNKQRLIKNTRFETASGKVYRVRNSIMVPGKTDSAPGQLDVRVYADEAGEDYNIESADLTLPGLTSLPDMYIGIYAKVKTPIVGGYTGERAVVNDEDKALASANLRNELRASIMTEVESRIPADTRYFDSGVIVNFTETKESEIDGKVQITESASVSVIVFNKKEFAAAISQGVAGNPSNGYPVIKDISDLTVRVDSKDDGNYNGNEEDEGDYTIKVLVTGVADFVWHFNESDLLQDLAGKQRDTLKTVLTGYPTIKNAEAIIRPFWRKTFSKNTDDFTINILDVE
ncbi:MAG: hypothetical protein LRZ97_00365 [Candidatus Pacebacteria bacterium]|nr:hypothetical protein [Candidatus Paceibacterota bacterium]